MVLLFICGGLGFIISIILLIVSVIKKKDKKKPLIAGGVCLLLFIVSLSMPTGTDNEKDTVQANAAKQTETETKDTEKKENKEETKKETEITEGELFDKVNELVSVKSITLIEDTDIGFKNLSIPVEVKKGTAIEEVEQYIGNIAQIQTSLKDYFKENKYARISYTLYVDGEMQSVVNSYKRTGEEYEIENSLIVDERYKKALEAM